MNWVEHTNPNCNQPVWVFYQLNYKGSCPQNQSLSESLGRNGNILTAESKGFEGNTAPRCCCYFKDSSLEIPVCDNQSNTVGENRHKVYTTNCKDSQKSESYIKKLAKKETQAK